MKTRSMKLAACLLLSTVMIAGAAGQASAAEEVSITPVSGVSVLLAEVNSEDVQADRAADILDMQAKKPAAANEKKTEKKEDKYAKMGVAQVEGYVNIRSKASTDSKIVGKLKNKAVATVEKKKGGWYKIKSGSISGYVKSDYLVVGDRKLIDSVSYRVAKVKTETLRVRKDASEDASVIGLVGVDDKLKVVSEKKDGWVKVKTADGKGFVSEDYVKVMDTYHYAEKIETASAGESGGSSAVGSGGSAVAGYALQFTGNPYVWGGTSLTNGADCSGFVMSVYAHFGVSLPHSSGALRGVGRGVSYSEAQPGDIICYDGHVGIYIGGGQLVHASNPSDGIKVSSATYRSILAVRRIF